MCDIQDVKYLYVRERAAFVTKSNANSKMRKCGCLRRLGGEKAAKMKMKMMIFEK